LTSRSGLQCEHTIDADLIPGVPRSVEMRGGDSQ